MIKQKHQQLFDILAEELRRGVWPRGTKLPNLKELSARHNVSINVASKAVELLKEKKLVTVKVGDGIYSCTSGQDAILEFKYSGRRLFGQYRSAKVLRVLLEDNTTWQREFWNPFFERVTREYPDIELKISYNLADSASVPEGFDIAFGHPNFCIVPVLSSRTACRMSSCRNFIRSCIRGCCYHRTACGRQLLRICFPMAP